MIDIKCFAVGPLDTNCYIIIDKDTGLWALIDPGFESSELENAISRLDSEKCRYILLTHGHYDHIGFAGELRNRLSAQVALSSEDEPFLCDNTLNLSSFFSTEGLVPISADIKLSNGDVLRLGGTEFYFMSTPGHTDGSGCFIFNNDRVIFSGDTLFRCSYGRTDFPTGSMYKLASSMRRLASLEGDFAVYPGHNEFTTLSFERENNPLMTFLKDH